MFDQGGQIIAAALPLRAFEKNAAQPSTPVLGTPFWHHAHA